MAAFGTGKALLLCLLLNALFALALARPLASALHATLDKGPAAARLLEREVSTFHAHFARNRPDVLGSFASWEQLATGEPVGKAFFLQSGAAGSLLWVGLVYAVLAGILSGGFAGRFCADKDRGSLAAFGSDCGRFAFSSIFLTAISMASAVGIYWLYAAVCRLSPTTFRYEWEAVLLALARLAGLLLLLGLARLVVLYARARIGLTRNGNPFLALATGAGFVLGRPLRTLSLELAFAVAGLMPLAAWVYLAPSWNGRDLLWLLLLVLLQQLLVAFRIAVRAGELGAACAYLTSAQEWRPARTPSGEVRRA